ncbi:MAG TPA: tRNA uridine-5-carboxymethylaminomethyl(34) synthesis GTPase MnmE [Candidatus Paceibacterota bacterium]|nr:tRNA uridine-5-carboxymethylaminomethyl(34) synthesis GTPase MnmE [Verrucomicrobiota bacterium]HRZ47217.1 tRNA uridine-5-carboxymethylaminomethyl(34) synthesis GTPase MnmE [Candidatus Paceibacterota bacterium]HRZ92199.1 tRNA uridine-5-carboxymethylaminomethyl(34) synthesis GTPase MnmE [Candidatus Paceibacterota bacterium]
MSRLDPSAKSGPRPQETAAADTIAAVATPLGEGGLAVIRISGPGAMAVADACFRPAGFRALKPSEAPSHTVHYGRVMQGGQTVDDVLLTVMRAPRTYTREDVVEISVHGGLLVARRALEAVLASGARLAHPGEFTQRAFLNGRLDLAQAEAVADLIRARTDLALAAAREQLDGRLSRRIGQLRDNLLETLAHIEAHIDFPDEDIAPDTREQLESRLEQADRFMARLLASAREGQVLRRGLRAAIVGRPNVGKSSLLNQLLGRDRAIVSPVPGTTRDTIEETASVRGFPVVFIDTAGLRESTDPLEMEGIRRSRAALDQAELILEVIDGSSPCTDADRDDLAAYAGRPRILVRNKIDLPSRFEMPAGLAAPMVSVSCRTGDGIEDLKEAIRSVIHRGDIPAEMLEVMIGARHQEALERARAAAGLTRAALRENAPLELAAMDLRRAVSAVGEIAGQTATEDLLEVIFRQFCLGK